MAWAIYMDEHIPAAITHGLRARGVRVLTAQEDDMTGSPDNELLDRATSLNMPLFTSDRDLQHEAYRRQARGQRFAGVIYLRPGAASARQCIDNLEVISGAAEEADILNQIIHLPGWF